MTLTVNNEYLAVIGSGAQGVRQSGGLDWVEDSKAALAEKREDGRVSAVGRDDTPGSKMLPRLTDGSELNIPDLEDLPPVLARPGRTASLYEQVVGGNTIPANDKTSTDKAEKDAAILANVVEELDTEESAEDAAVSLREAMAEHRRESEEKALSVLRWREQLY